MAIKARFPSGTNSIKLDALYQWDYGQELEIESEDLLSSIVEVHFSCSGMTEAIVHSASVLNGIATVRIPDACLEQTINITAWVYEIDGTQGRTTKSIIIPVISRARPNRPAEIPQIVSDVYTQLITEVNEAIEGLKSGAVTVKKSQESEKAAVATSAETATRAISANVAESANIANTADTAGTAGVLSSNWITLSNGTTASISFDTPLEYGTYMLAWTYIATASAGNFRHVSLFEFNPTDNAEISWKSVDLPGKNLLIHINDHGLFSYEDAGTGNLGNSVKISNVKIKRIS